MPMKERRKHRRAVVNKNAWICNYDLDPPPLNPEKCLIIDISEGGACVQCAARYEKGQLLAFTFQDFIEDGLRPVVGTVMWSKRYSEAEYRYGIEFLGLGTEMRCKIRDSIGR